MVYTRVRTEEEKDLRFEQEVDESASTWLLAQYVGDHRRNRLLAILLGLWIVTFGALIYVLVASGRGYENHSVHKLPLKRIPSRVVTFNPDPRFHYTAADNGNAAWMTLMPNDGGIISIQNPQTYNLPTSFKDQHNSSQAEVYSISMFHQLHCLNSIRTRLGVLEGFTAAPDSLNGHLRRNVFSGESHVDHCFDYLRQAVMCAGDMSLEHSVVRDEFGFNGWGAEHLCADWGAMWDFAESRRYVHVEKE